ncbi:hypothetical protein ACROYT_G034798 [Oculina patagonica]
MKGKTVIIEGIRGSGYHGDIGIDDVELSQEISCPGTVEGIPLRKVAHWKLDGSETAVRDAMYSNDGGRNVLYFNGSTQTAVPSIDLTTFTVALWIKPMLGKSQYIIGADKQFFLHLNELGKFMARINLNHGDQVGPHGVMTVRNNSWTHIAVTWDELNKTMSMFIDAALTLKSSENTDSTLGKQERHDYWLGWRSNRPNMVYHGFMRDLQIFNKVLSQAELQSIKALNSTIYNNAIAYYPMDTSSGLLNLKLQQEIPLDDKFVAIGPVNGAVLFDRAEVFIDPFEVRCLWKPHECINGLSLTFWINILQVYGNETLLLSQGHGENWPGVTLKVFTLGTERIFQISVITDHPSTRCEAQFNYKASTWMHVAFTWYNRHEMYLYLNGIMQFSVLCIGQVNGPVPPPPFSSFILGSPDATILLDDVALWDRWLSVGEVYDIYYTVVEGVMKNISVEAKFINETWHDKLQDPESETYENFRDKLLLNLQQLFRDSGLYDLEINQLRAGSVDANFTIMFFTLTYTHILALEEALFINKSLGNMTIGNVAWQFGDQIPQEAPNITHVTMLNETSVEITWEGIPLGSFAGAPQGYKVVYYENSRTHSYQHVLVPGLINFTRIEGLQANTYYSMQVLAVNVFADGPLSDTVIVKMPATTPSLPPQNITAISTGPHNITVTWIPANETVHVLGYEIYWKRLYDNFTNHFTSKSLESQVNITSLQASTWYQVTVRAYNSKGSGPNSSYVDVRTQNNVHVRPRPQNVTVTARNSTSVTVKWLPVSRHLVSQPPYNYTVQWVAVKGGIQGVITNVTVSVTSYHISGLAPYTKYNISVAVRDWNETGRFSDPLCVHTLESVPSQSPQNVTVYNLTTNSLLLTWNLVLPEFANGRIQGYRVRVWRQLDGMIPGTLSVTMINNTSAVIGGLRSYTKYTVQVSAFTSAGEGNSTSLTVITHRGGLLPPENVTANVTSSTSVAVQWRPVPRVNNAQNAYNYRVTWASKNVRTSVTVAATSYTIQALKPFTTYEISVAAVDGNQIGMFSDAVWVLTQEGVPSQPPQNVSAQNLSYNSFLLTWDPVLQEFANGRIQGYRVRVWELRLWITSVSPNVTCTVDNITTSALIGGLNPGIKYIVQLSAFTSVGEGVNTQINVTTDEGVPSRPPQQVQGIHQSSTSLLITWSGIPARYAHGIITEYNVYVNNNSRRVVGSGARMIVLTGLNKYTPYSVQISANTSKGEGPRSQPITVWTDEDVLSAPPANVSVFVSGHSSIQVTWLRVPGDSVNGITTGYQVKVLNSNGHLVTQITTYNTTFNLEIKHLKRYGNYCIEVAAFNRKGQGPLSNDFCVVTDDGAPCDPPKSIAVNDVTATTADIQWTYHSNCSVPGFIRGYRLIYDLQGAVPSPPAFLQVMGENTKAVVLTGLKPYSTYRIRIQVMTASGRDGQPSTVWVRTQEGVPSKAPSGLEAFVVLETEIYLRWSSVPQGSQNGIIRGFKIFYHDTGGTTHVTVIKEEGKRLYALTGLRPFTEYQVRILAYTYVGDGVKSPRITVVTDESVPSAPPTNVTVLEKSSTTSLSIQWMKVPDNETNGHLTGYVVSYQAVKIGGKKVVDEVVRKRTVGSGTYSLVLDDLQSFTTYEIRVAARTRRGEGVYSQPIIGETCHCEKRLTTNYWFYPPYVISSPTNNMSGIFMAFLDKMVLHCCGDCHNGHGKSIMDYTLDGSNNPARKNTEEEMRIAIDADTDLSLPAYGFSDQRKYMNNFRFVPVVESPGAAFIVTTEGLKSKSFIERLVFGCGPLLLFNVTAICLTGLLMWIMESVGHDSIFPRSFLRGFPEGIWWSFVTMSTVGYGDRIPLTYGGRFLTFVWMLSGTVIFTLLISYISSGLAVATLENSIKLYGSKVAALQDTPEYRLGIRRNAQMNPGRNYTQLGDIRQDLLSGVVKGALVDSYVAAERKDLFDDPALYIHQLIYYRSSFGIVLSGNSTRLQYCFLDYLVKKRSLLTDLVKNYTKTLPRTTSSVAEEKTSDLLSNSKEKLETVLLFLALITAAATVSGIVYDLVMRTRRKRRVYSNDESTKKLRYRNELRKEMNQLVEEFYAAVRQRYTSLRAKHREERRLARRCRVKRETRRSGARVGSALMIEDLTKNSDGKQ